MSLLPSVRKPWWQQATALVSLSAGGAITGFSVVPKPAADITSPTGMPIRLLALERSARPAAAADATLRSAVVNVANYYLRIAEGKSPAEMEAIIWQQDSLDGVDHGATCAAFASLTLELAAQVVGQQSWVTGGTSYPWPLHQWADVRVDPNPASPGITSIRQDAQAHQRWHPLGDGYAPLPGDWVMFNGHVEVVTNYSGRILHTVGGDSRPNLSVNAHEYRDPLRAQGVVGFVNNGALTEVATVRPASNGPVPRGQQAPGPVAQELAVIPGSPTVSTSQQPVARSPGSADIPGITAAAPATGTGTGTGPGPGSGHDKQPVHRQAQPRRPQRPNGSHPPRQASPGKTVHGHTPRARPSGPTATSRAEVPGTASIPGFPVTTPSPPGRPPGSATTPYGSDQPAPAAAAGTGTAAQQAFISVVAPGAVAVQQRYGVPAAVTIAQAIEESGWGRSDLAIKDHNLFGIKGTGPAGSDPQPTREYVNGQWVNRITLFRVYHDVAECIEDHGRLLASSVYYKHAMAVRQVPNAFAARLTGVYATDPDYGTKLIGIMRQHNLYRYDVAAPAATTPRAAAPGGAAIPGLPDMSAAQAVGAPATAASSTATVGPGPQSDGYRRLAQPKQPAHGMSARRLPAQVDCQPQKTAVRNARTCAKRYEPHLPSAVKNAFIVTAKVPLTRAEPLYRDVASHSGIRWELLAACDWMQCEARPRFSPVHGEKLGTLNPDGTVYRTKSEALAQCAEDLRQLARTVYRIDLTAPEALSVRDLANTFAAFRWGALLQMHHTSAMEFPYAVAGLTAHHINMRWPNIDAPKAPDKPGARFHKPFGAVPIVLALDYPATV